MAPRTTSGRAADRRARSAHSRSRPPAAVRRPGLYLGAAVAGAVLVGVVVGTDPATPATSTEAVSVAHELGLTAQAGPVDVTEHLRPLEELAATRSSREAAEVAAQQAQTAADQAELDRRAAEAAAAEAAARAAAEEAAAEEAARAEAAKAAESAKAAKAAKASAATGSASRRAPEPAAAASSAGVSVVARIRNSAGNVKPVVQDAANLVTSNVPGISSIGGTRASAADPGGHPSGLAVDYMTTPAVGDAVVAYHIAHWDQLGVDYLIWEQRMLSSPNGSWKTMENRGSATANHMDHVHVNHRG